MQVTYSQLGNAGRLGNQLWEIASTIGIARAHGAEPVFPDWDYRPFFSLPDSMFGDTSGAVESTSLVTTIDPREVIYLQRLDLWIDIEREIRECFAPSPQARNVLENLEEQFRGGTALQVRRGDLLNPGNDEYHPVVPMEYYRRAIEMTSPPWIVFTDDYEWCSEQFQGYNFRVLQGVVRSVENYWQDGPVDWIDLFRMGYCHHHIIGNSTYGWWGAYLTDTWPEHKVIYPNCWYGWRLRHVDWKAMIPKGWTEVKC